jgi:hypothetical protein
MQPYFPEVFVQRALAAHLHMRGHQVREEVLFGSSRFDIISFDGAKVCGFEVKLSSWSRAIRQARIYKLCCDQVYLVIPSVKVSESIKSRCLAEGIGLVAIGHPPTWTFELVLEAPDSASRNALHHASIQRIASFLCHAPTRCVVIISCLPATKKSK